MKRVTDKVVPEAVRSQQKLIEENLRNEVRKIKIKAMMEAFILYSKMKKQLTSPKAE
jgi:hypothetical protein